MLRGLTSINIPSKRTYIEILIFLLALKSVFLVKGDHCDSGNKNFRLILGAWVEFW